MKCNIFVFVRPVPPRHRDQRVAHRQGAHAAPSARLGHQTGAYPQLPHEQFPGHRRLPRRETLEGTGRLLPKVLCKSFTEIVACKKNYLVILMIYEAIN